MTTKELKEIKSKFESNEGSINDLGLILCEMFESISSHMKEIKAQNNTINETIECIFEAAEEIKQGLNPVYTIIQNDD